MTYGKDVNKDSLTLDRPAGVGQKHTARAGVCATRLRWSREFRLSKKKKDEGPAVTVGLNAVNVTNHTNFSGYVGNLSSLFRPSVAARPSRRLQLSFQLAF
jgi:hypothetical protein